MSQINEIEVGGVVYTIAGSGGGGTSTAANVSFNDATAQTGKTNVQDVLDLFAQKIAILDNIDIFEETEDTF